MTQSPIRSALPSSYLWTACLVLSCANGCSDEPGEDTGTGGARGGSGGSSTAGNYGKTGGSTHRGGAAGHSGHENASGGEETSGGCDASRGSATGGERSGGSSSGGDVTGGSPIGGSSTGGFQTGGSSSGGAGSGGYARGGAPTGGNSTGGATTGGAADGGNWTGGSSSGGEAIGGNGTGGSATGGEATAGSPSGGNGGSGVGTGGVNIGGIGGSGAGTGGTVGTGGAGGTGGAAEQVRWLGPCVPLDISNDGRTLLAREGVWTEASGWIALPDLPGGDERNTPRALSGDGRVVYGDSSSALGAEIYRWTAADGIQGLAQRYVDARGIEPLEVPIAMRGIDTNDDGSLLVGYATDGEHELFRWTSSGGFAPFNTDAGTSGDPAFLVLSANGETLAFPTGKVPPIGVISTRSVSVVSQGTTRDFPTAVSGDGSIVAAYFTTFGGATPFGSQTYLGVADCNLAVHAFSYAGDFATGTEYYGNGGLRDPVGAFLWSGQRGISFLTDALFQRGRVVDVVTASQSLLSSDALHVFGQATRHFANDSARTECFLATLEPEAPAPSSVGTLGPIPANCGNGVIDSGEDCDDGNSNNSDGCTIRCSRPKLSASSSGACSLLANGKASCWGVDALPFVGGDTTASYAPVGVPSLTDAAQLSSNGDHACALAVGGQVRCWGRGNLGQLGNGQLADSTTPVLVSGITDAVQVSARSANSCALRADGTVLCWGLGERGQLGNGTFEASPVPSTVTSLDRVVQITHINGICGLSPTPAARPFAFPVRSEYGAACALRDDGSVWCWGSVPPADPEEEGEARVEVVSSALPIHVFDGVRQISSGQDHTCLLLTSGETRCWGISHQVSTDVNGWRDSSIFEDDDKCKSFVVTVPADTVQIADGSSATCALGADGRVHCGNLWLTQLRGARKDSPGQPAHVLGTTNAVQIAMGSGHVCATNADDTILCWGLDDAGQLGIGHVYTNYPGGLAIPALVAFP